LTENNNDWLIQIQSKTALPRYRLICFPFAGGGTSNYARWRGDLQGQIELCAFNLPGRERFFGKPCLTDYQDLIIRLAAVLKDKTDCPMIFYGHSFGALTAYFTTLELNKLNLDVPIHLYVSARRPPHSDDHFDKLSTLNLEDFKVVLTERYQGIPQPILDSPDLLELFLPIIQKDFKLYEQYPMLLNHYPESKVNCSITSIGYSGDRLKEIDLMEWKELTNKSFQHIQLPGGHFDLLTNWKPVTDRINQLISRDGYL
jgi:medium-chain acyl-[acyl-carrier-protein] hydrolase